MKDIVLKVEDLSKVYRLGEIGTGTLSHDLNKWWAKVRGKEDPYTIIGGVNDRTQKAQKGEYVKALSDINFEVSEGKVLGIIGKNGAGKSTLLKVISKITSPTTGSIKARGRIASLLEVGTGMHPEMTGKENVYLNGTILGMTRKEIDVKFDEIMDFAGCSRYADTPVKRYSSGMKVRLGFAVAAFLEPEILIVDEVLAVGDAEFQQKAIGKMKDISTSGGRTVLFVSHNMASVKGLCEDAIVMENGMISFTGTADEAVSYYLENNRTEQQVQIWKNDGLKLDDKVRLHSIEAVGEKGSTLSADGKIIVNIKFEKEHTPFEKYDFTLQVKDQEGEILFPIASSLTESLIPKEKGMYNVRCLIPANFFNTGKFYLNLFLIKDTNILVKNVEDVIVLPIEPRALKAGEYSGTVKGFLRPHFPWQLTTV